MPNYNYVVDSSFRPFSMEEMLVPFSLYKDAYEKSEQAYSELSDKADTFKYLSKDLPEESEARKIYEGYANSLQAQAEDLAKHGLTMSNRRALTNLKRRYQGEIGQLEKANSEFEKERDIRRQLSIKDPSMLYAQDNLTIDDFLGERRPNLYNVSGNDLYSKGVAASKAASSRVYDSKDGGATLGGYYRDYIERMGYTPEDLLRFGDEIKENFTGRISTLPELQQIANEILEANGVNANLSGESLNQAQRQVIRGIVDGAIYSESHKPVKDDSKPTPYQAAQIALQQEAQDWDRYAGGWRQNQQGIWEHFPELDVTANRSIAINNAKKTNSSTSSGTGKKSGSTSERQAMLPGGVRLEWSGKVPRDTKVDAKEADNVKATDLPNSEVEHKGKPVRYDELPDFVQERIDILIGGSHPDNYVYYFDAKDNGRGTSLDIVPRKPLIFEEIAGIDEQTGYGSY